MDARGAHQRFRARRPGRAAGARSTEEEQHAAQLREEAAYLRARSLNYRCCSIRQSTSSRVGGPTALSRRAPRSSTARLGRGLHRDRRLELRLPRPARRRRASPPLYGGREILRAKLDEFFDTPESGRSPGHLRPRHPRDGSRPGRCGWDSSGSPTSPHTTSPSSSITWPAPEIASAGGARGASPAVRGRADRTGLPGGRGQRRMSAWWLLTALGLSRCSSGPAATTWWLRCSRCAPSSRWAGEPFTAIATEARRRGSRLHTGDDRDGRGTAHAWIDHADLRGRLHVALGSRADAGGLGLGCRAVAAATPVGDHPQPLRDLFSADPSGSAAG